MMNQARATDKSMNISNAIHIGIQTFTNLVSGQVVPYTKFLLHHKKLEKVKEKLGYQPGVFDREVRNFVEGTRAQVMSEMDNWAAQHGNPSILLITGLPGCGKSTLADMWGNSRHNGRGTIEGEGSYSHCFLPLQEPPLQQLAVD